MGLIASRKFPTGRVVIFFSNAQSERRFLTGMRDIKPILRADSDRYRAQVGVRRSINPSQSRVQPAEPLELAAAINALLRVRRSEGALHALNATLDQQVQNRTAELASANNKLRHEIARRGCCRRRGGRPIDWGFTHDFNNLLTAVVGNLDLICARSTEPRIARLAENAFKAAERGSKLTARCARN